MTFVPSEYWETGFIDLISLRSDSFMFWHISDSEFPPKNENGHDLLTLMSLSTCMGHTSRTIFNLDFHTSDHI